MKKFLIALWSASFSWSATARTLDLEALGSPVEIDSGRSTVLILPESAQLLLKPKALKIDTMDDGSPSAEGSTVWTVDPQCRKGCRDREATSEFVLASGRHLSVTFRLRDRVKDHVLTLEPVLPLGHIDRSRASLMLRAREIFLQTVRGAPALSPSMDDVPASIKDSAESWKTFRSDDLVAYVGSNFRGSVESTEHLSDPALILVGFEGHQLIAVSRRTP